MVFFARRARIFTEYGRPSSNLGTRQIGDRGQMASQRLSDLLAMAITLFQTRLEPRLLTS